MNAPAQRSCRHTLLLASCLSLVACSEVDTTWFAIEQGGRQIGYASVAVAPGDSARGAPTEIRTHISLSWSLLGERLDLEIRETQTRDPVSGEPLDIAGSVDSGSGGFAAKIHFETDSILISSPAAAGQTRIPREAGLVVDDGLDFRYLVEAFEGVEPGAERSYRLLDTAQGKIVDRVSRLVGSEPVQLDVGRFDCLVVDNTFTASGASGRLWLDRASGLPVQTLDSQGTRTYLSDRRARLRVRRGDLDGLLLAQVEERIEPVEDIRFMRVRARIRTVGEVVTPASLSGPGQTFEGTVTGNVIEGTFEIRHEPFDPSTSPAFPGENGSSASLRPWTEPGFLIESDAPAITARAEQLTGGARDRWEAVQRIGRWVDEAIADEVSGRSALQCLETMGGECGGHSRLFVALCRAVGIPSRLVTGGAYFIGKGGAFGQHVWTEVHMGEAGWVPLDATFGELDVLDSGHLRLGSNTTFYPLEVEILEFRLAGNTAPDPR